MTSATSVNAVHGEALQLDEVPALAWRDFREVLLDGAKSGARVAAYFATSPESAGRGDLLAVLADDERGRLLLARARDWADDFESLTPQCPQLHLFEREIAEQTGIAPKGHPWLKPVRYHAPYTDPAAAPRAPGVTDFYRVEGEEVHEVGVGPVHAGIIEPGHFRFQCHGEIVFHLEIALGYQHRGVERAMIAGPAKRLVHYAETLAGDTAIGHATAYCQAIEALTNCRVPPRAHTIRGIALELERIANHVGDLGALANDVGFLPTASFCGRIRGDFLNMTALICGSRFGRGLVRQGGVGFDLDGQRRDELLRRIEAGAKDTEVAVNLLWDSPSVMARFEETGSVSQKTCEMLGLVGPAARACGTRRDVRQDHPSGIYQFAHIPVSSWTTGDVFARAYVRWLEIQQSLKFIQEQLRGLPSGPVRTEIGGLPRERLTISLNEGWRGEICHVAITDREGRLSRYKVVDPSFHNWSGLAMALRDQQISDFPLCNKSLNLSYCGHDL